MMKHVWAKVAAVAGTTALIAAGALVGGTAAQASATLPASDAMYALNCDNTMPYSLASIDPTTGDLTGVGQQTDIQGDCFAPGAYDPVSGYVYVPDWDYSGVTLVQINVTTGQRTVIGEMWDAANSQIPSIYSLVIDNNGNAYVMGSYEIYSLDLTTGALTYINSTNIDCPYAAGFDPTDNTLYAGEYCNSPETFYTVSTVDGSTSSIGDWQTATSGNDSPVAMQFDSNGTLWVEDDGGNYSLWSVTDMSNFNTTATEEASAMQYNGSNAYFESLLITRGTVTNPTLGAAPAGGKLFSLNCDGGNPYRLTDVSTTDATGTGVGVQTYTDRLCFGQAAWDASTKTGYAVDWNYSNTALSAINFENGEVTMINEFQDAANPGTTVNMYSMAIDSKGNAYGVDDNGDLWSIDLTDGKSTYIGDTGMTYVYALAFNPVNDKLYGIEYDFSPYTINEINVTDASTTEVGDASNFPSTVESLQFTETGLAYFESDDDTLWKGDILNAAAATEVGTFTVDSTEYYTESLVYIPATPSLPDTGLNGVSATVGGLSVVFLIAAGAVLLVVRRRMAQQ